MPPPAHRPICSTASPSSTSTPISPSHPTRGPHACPPSLHERVPHIERIDGNDVWMAAGERLGASRLLLDGRLRRRHAGVDPEDVRRDPRGDVRRRRRGCAFLDEQGIRAQVLYPNVGGFGNGYFLRLGDRELVAQCVQRVQRLPPRLVQRRSRPAARGDRAAVLGRRPRHRRAAPRHRARPPGGELLQPAPGLRPASARAPALGPGVGRGAGGRHLGELPRRRRLDGHAVRRRRRAWGG